MKSIDKILSIKGAARKYLKHAAAVAITILAVVLAAMLDAYAPMQGLEGTTWAWRAAAFAKKTASTDHIKIIALVEAAAEFAREVLAPGGTFLAKVLQGGTEATLLGPLKRDFKTVKHVKPSASRSDSAELYLLATGFRG